MTEKKKPGRVGVLSAVIDPLLFAGGKRVFQIANEVVAHFGDKYDKKQVVNNIRSRITFLTTRKKHRFEKNSLKQVQLISELPAEGTFAEVHKAGTLESHESYVPGTVEVTQETK